MNDDIGSEFPLIAAISCQEQGGRSGSRDEGSDINGLRAAVDEPGMSYRSFDNLNHIPGREANTSLAGGLGAPLFGDMSFGDGEDMPLFGAAEPHSVNLPLSSVAPLFSSADPLMSPPPQPNRTSASSPVSSGDLAAFQNATRETVPPVVPAARTPRRMRLAEMFQILRGAASGRGAPSDLRNMFR